MPSTLNIRDNQLALSAQAGIANLAAASWDASVRPAQEFQAVLALRIVLAAYLVGEVTRQVSEGGQTIITATLDNRHAPPERVAAAQLLLAPLGAYSDLAGLKMTIQNDIGDVGAVPIPIPILITAGAVAVTMVLARAGVIMWVAQKAADIVDGALLRNDASKELQRADAEALKLVNNHVQREQAAGTTLPIDEATKTALQGLQARVDSIVQASFQSAAQKGLPSWVLPAAGIAAASLVTAVLVMSRRRKSNV
jgi:hypothetical protein